MMNLLLSSVSASALLGEGPSGPDQVNLVAKGTYTTNGNQFTSNSSSGEQWAYGDKILGVNPPHENFIGYYWELSFTGAATTNHNSYNGVMDAANKDVIDFPQDLTWRGTGNKYVNGNAAGGISTYTNSNRLMFFFNPYSGEIWYGEDGEWYDDPLTGIASSKRSAGEYVVCVQSRHGGSEGGTLHSILEDFAYEPPLGSTPLGSEVPTTAPPEIAISGASTYVIIGPRKDATDVNYAKTFVIVEP